MTPTLALNLFVPVVGVGIVLISVGLLTDKDGIARTGFAVALGSMGLLFIVGVLGMWGVYE